MAITGWRYAKHVLFSAEGSRGLTNHRHKWRESRAYVAAKKQRIERELKKVPQKFIAAAKVEGAVRAGGIAICDFRFFDLQVFNR